MNRYFKYSLFLLCLVLFAISSVSLASAQPDLQGQIGAHLEAGAQGADIAGRDTDPRVYIASLIQIMLTFVGTIFLILMLLGGYWLIIARGRQEYIEKAYGTIRRAVIGLGVTLAAYAITALVSQFVLQSTGQIEPEPQTQGNIQEFFTNEQQGIIQEASRSN